MSIVITYSPDYRCDGYGVDTREKAVHIAASLVDRPIEGVVLIAPREASVEQVARVHDRRYVEAIRTGRPERLALRNGLGDWSRDLARSVFSMTGGVIESVVFSLENGAHSGSLASGLHHAKFASGAGFCTLNGLVIGAREALIRGAARVLIVDLDAHCGGGTASLIEGVRGIEQVDVSVNGYDRYPDTPNATLIESTGERYLDDVERTLSSVVDPSSIDLVIYNAGMDPHEDCTTGGASGISTDVLARREEMVFGWADGHGLPVSFVLAGGYSGRRLSRERLVDLHRLTIATAAGVVGQGTKGV